MKRILTAGVAFLAVFSSGAQNCPSIKVNTSSFEVGDSDPLQFIAEIKPSAESATYNWSISSGTISSGQGTSSITVITEKLGGSSITATVEIGGLPPNCTTSSSSTVEVLKAAEKIISANYTTPQALATAIQKFITNIDLKNLSLSQTAFIYIYSGSTTTAAQLKAINTTIAKEFEKKGILSFQYKIANGGKKKTASFEMYRVMSGSAEPKPSK